MKIPDESNKPKLKWVLQDRDDPKKYIVGYTKEPFRMEPGIVYAPYIPILKTTPWVRFKLWIKRIFRRLFRRNRIGNFDSYIFPVIKKAFPTLCVKDLIEVQPMQLPSSQVFYLDFKREIPKRSWYSRIFKRRPKIEKAAKLPK